MLQRNMNIIAVYAGISGAASGDNRKKILKFLRSSYQNLKFEVQTDILNVIYSVGDFEKCIAVICGTGSVVYSKENDELCRFGGWGYLLEEYGSGYSIGRDVLRTALMQNDDLSHGEIILTLVNSRLGGNIWENIDKIYSSSMDHIASFATVAFEAYLQGDRAARQIIEQNAKGLMYFVNAASESLKGNNTIILSGSIIQKCACFRDCFLQMLPKETRVLIADVPQVIGAAARCCRLFGEETQDFLQAIKKNYKELQEKKDVKDRNEKS